MFKTTKFYNDVLYGHLQQQLGNAYMVVSIRSPDECTGQIMKRNLKERIKKCQLNA